MSDLVLRKIPFDFTGVDFVWNPHNVAFSLMMNQVTVQAIGFERYICRAMRDAERHITDPMVLEEARAFNAQEMVHSQSHKRHLKALIESYPDLEAVFEESNAGFDEIYRRENLHFHLAYAANIEATFTPLFGTIIEHREALFGGGDPRVTALMLWHFCEEIEHRSSALTVYNHVVKNRFYRSGQFRKVLGHISANAAAIQAGFKKILPALPPSAYKGALKSIPFAARARMVGGVLESQLPWHNPQRGKVPAYYRTWRNRYESGEDMTVERIGGSTTLAREQAFA